MYVVKSCVLTMSNPFPTESNIVNFPLPVEDVKPAIYIAGPMTGYPNLNHELFNDTAEAFEDGGWEVFNPAEADLAEYGSVEETEKAMTEDNQAVMRNLLSTDLAWICERANAIAMLPGWERSLGARAEHATAVALGIEIIYLSS
jgi:hypothetical protein